MKSFGPIFIASISSVATTAILTLSGFYLHRFNYVTIDGKKSLARFSQQIALPALFFTKLISCNNNNNNNNQNLITNDDDDDNDTDDATMNDIATLVVDGVVPIEQNNRYYHHDHHHHHYDQSCPNVWNLLPMKSTCILMMWPIVVILFGLLVGRLICYMNQIPIQLQSSIMVTVAFGNSTGLPTALLTVLHEYDTLFWPNYSEIDPVTILPLYLILFQVFMWVMGGWLLSNTNNNSSNNNNKEINDNKQQQQSTTTSIAIITNTNTVHNNDERKEEDVENLSVMVMDDDSVEKQRKWYETNCEIELPILLRPTDDDEEEDDEGGGEETVNSPLCFIINNDNEEKNHHSLTTISQTDSNSYFDSVNEIELSYHQHNVTTTTITTTKEISKRMRIIISMITRTIITTINSMIKFLWKLIVEIIWKQPPVFGIFMGLFFTSWIPLRQIWIETTTITAMTDDGDDELFYNNNNNNNNYHTPLLGWLLDALRSLGQAAIPINMAVLGINLSITLQQQQEQQHEEKTTTTTTTTANESNTVSIFTILCVVVGKLVIMPIIGFTCLQLIRSLFGTHFLEPPVVLVLLVVFVTPTANTVMLMVDLVDGAMKEEMARIIAFEYIVAPFILPLSVAMAAHQAQDS